jgi:hypothetical protein
MGVWVEEENIDDSRNHVSDFLQCDQTSFENKKAAVETVTPMMDKDGIRRVSGYYIK